jgi:CheY-like chemotaxis protein
MSLVLAIDDDPHMLKIIEEQLLSMNYRVIVSNHPAKGIELAKTGGPSLILLDIMMPEMNGFEALRRLQADEITARIPVIMLSSKTDRDSVVSAMKLGVADYMVKPCHPPLLQKKIDTAINYSIMKHDSESSERGKYITVKRGTGRTVLSFVSASSEKGFIDDLKTIFHKGFLTMTARDIMVIDMRSLDILPPNYIPVLTSIITFFGGKDLNIIAGKHYGAIITECDFPDTVKLYISPGDMEAAINL